MTKSQATRQVYNILIKTYNNLFLYNDRIYVGTLNYNGVINNDYTAVVSVEPMHNTAMWKIIIQDSNTNDEKTILTAVNQNNQLFFIKGKSKE